MSTPLSEPWLHPSLKPTESSIEGTGLRATSPIPAGTRVVTFAGRLVTDSELAAVFEAATAYVDTLSIGEDLNLILPGWTPVGFGNHSCDPNLWWMDPMSLVTRRSLIKGEEATLDYATITDSDDYELRCSCRSALCRGVVTGLDWRLKPLRAAYGDHWTPGLLRKINTSSRS